MRGRAGPEPLKFCRATRSRGTAWSVGGSHSLSAAGFQPGRREAGPSWLGGGRTLRSARSPSGIHLQPPLRVHRPPHVLPDSPGEASPPAPALPLREAASRCCAHCACDRELLTPFSAQGPGPGSCWEWPASSPRSACPVQGPCTLLAETVTRPEGRALSHPMAL